MNYFLDSKGNLFEINYNNFYQKKEFYTQILEKKFNYISEYNVVNDITNQINSIIKKSQKN